MTRVSQPARVGEKLIGEPQRQLIFALRVCGVLLGVDWANPICSIPVLAGTDQTTNPYAAMGCSPSQPSRGLA